ncbi:MAG: protein of unknown function transrane [Ignavibacteria bacterium]|nr:protein of unknown function transrane [Ignavibacteria bacterium]
MYLLILLQQLIASGTHIIAKNLTNSVSPVVVLFYRSSLSALIFTCWILYKHKFLPAIERKDFLMLIILGALNIPINQFLFLQSIHFTTAPNVALAYALTPAFVAMLVIFLHQEKITLLKGIGIAGAIGGVVLILFERGLEFKSEYFFGNILALAASISWAGYTVFGRDILRKYGAIYTTGITMIIGFLLYLPIFIFLPDKIVLAALDIPKILSILYLALFTSVIAYVLWYYALKKIDASSLTVFNNLQPVLTSILAYFIFEQSFSVLFISGGILIIIGVILTQKR